jgi:hypothetical protein
MLAQLDQLDGQVATVSSVQPLPDPV